MNGQEEIGADLFRKFEVFDGLTAEDIRVVSNCSQVRRFEAGHPVLEEGSRDRDLYGLLEGRVEVLQESESGTQEKLTELEPYAAFGELGLAVGAPRTATVRTVEPSRFLFVDGDGFHNLQTSQHESAYKVEHNILRIVSRRLRDTNRELMKETAGDS
jgi:CRP-like cAMP-binding protein